MSRYLRNLVQRAKGTAAPAVSARPIPAYGMPLAAAAPAPSEIAADVATPAPSMDRGVPSERAAPQNPPPVAPHGVPQIEEAAPSMTTPPTIDTPASIAPRAADVLLTPTDLPGAERAISEPSPSMEAPDRIIPRRSAPPAQITPANPLEAPAAPPAKLPPAPSPAITVRDAVVQAPPAKTPPAPHAEAAAPNDADVIAPRVAPRVVPRPASESSSASGSPKQTPEIGTPTRGVSRTVVQPPPAVERRADAPRADAAPMPRQIDERRSIAPAPAPIRPRAQATALETVTPAEPVTPPAPTQSAAAPAVILPTPPAQATSPRPTRRSVDVHIGSLEVRFDTPKAPEASPRPAAPRPSLDEYAARRRYREDDQ